MFTMEATTPTNVRLSKSMLELLEEFRATMTGYKPSLSDAIREVITLGLQHRREGRTVREPKPAPVIPAGAKHVADTIDWSAPPAMGSKPRAPSVKKAAKKPTKKPSKRGGK